MTARAKAADRVDWDQVDELARAAYQADPSVIDGHDFESGYKAAVAEFAKRVSLGDAWQVGDPMFKEVDVKVPKRFYRMLHGVACNAIDNGS